MKPFLIVMIFISSLRYGLHITTEYEKHIFIKAVLYILISSYNLVFMEFSIPIGIFISIIFYWHANKNKKIKRLFILSGLCIFLITAIPSSLFVKPFKMIYLYGLTQDTSTIDIYTVNISKEENQFLSITNSTQVKRLIRIIQKAEPIENKNIFYKPFGDLFHIRCKLSNDYTDIYILKTFDQKEMLFLGNHWVPYQTNNLYDIINSVKGTAPEAMTISDKNKQLSTISHKDLLSDLWNNIYWFNKPEEVTNNLQLNYTLQLNNEIINGKIANDFSLIEFRGNIYEIYPYLQKQLYDEYLLNQLSEIVYTEPSNTDYLSKKNIKTNEYLYSVEEIENLSKIALYRNALIDNEKELLLSFQAISAGLYKLKDPYILLYQKKENEKENLLIIKQIPPFSKRFIISNKNIKEDSIAIDPYKEKIAFIVKEKETTSVQLIKNIYQEPIRILDGNISQIMFISSNYLAITETNKNETRLYLYNLDTHTKHYISIFNSIELLYAKDTSIVFRVDKENENKVLSGLYTLDTKMHITKIK